MEDRNVGDLPFLRYAFSAKGICPARNDNPMYYPCRVADVEEKVGEDLFQTQPHLQRTNMSRHRTEYRQRCIRPIIKPKALREVNLFEHPDGTLHASGYQIGTTSTSKIFFLFIVGDEEQVRFIRSAESNVAAERKFERGRDLWPPVRLEFGLCLKVIVTIYKYAILAGDDI